MCNRGGKKKGPPGVPKGSFFSEKVDVFMEGTLYFDFSKKKWVAKVDFLKVEKN